MMQGSATPPEPTPQLWWSGLDGIVGGNTWVDRIRGVSMDIRGGGSISHNVDNMSFTNKEWSICWFSVPQYFTAEIDTNITHIFGHSPLLQLSHSQWRAIATLNNNFYLYTGPAGAQYALNIPVPIGSRHKYKLALLPDGKYFYIDGVLVWNSNDGLYYAGGNTITTCGFATLGGNYYLAQDIYDIKIWWEE